MGLTPAMILDKLSDDAKGDVREGKGIFRVEPGIPGEIEEPDNESLREVTLIPYKEVHRGSNADVELRLEGATTGTGVVDTSLVVGGVTKGL